MKLTFSITLLSTLGYASAFSTPSANLSIKKNLLPPSSSERVVSAAAAASASTTKLFMAEEDEEDDGPISDELSALIGKRASLTKKTNEPRSTPSAKDLANEDYIDPNMNTASYDGKTGMDIYDMPDFKAARPLKNPKESEDKKRSSGAEQKDDSGGEYVDFQAEYDDENDFHIPNRIGFTTKAWGDESAGFKAGKKLKKKEIKSGKYLAGDLQVCTVYCILYTGQVRTGTRTVVLYEWHCIHLCTFLFLFLVNSTHVKSL